LAPPYPISLLRGVLKNMNVKRITNLAGVAGLIGGATLLIEESLELLRLGNEEELASELIISMVLLSAPLKKIVAELEKMLHPNYSEEDIEKKINEILGEED